MEDNGIQSPACSDLLTLHITRSVQPLNIVPPDGNLTAKTFLYIYNNDVFNNNIFLKRTHVNIQLSFIIIVVCISYN